jgi:TRAP-type C4-dicarboxylate transport system permease large subunit
MSRDRLSRQAPARPERAGQGRALGHDRCRLGTCDAGDHSRRILGGIFTATEAGAVACIWAFFVTMFVYRDYRWRDLPVLLHRTLRTVAMVLTLIACASSVGYVMALTQMPAKMTAFFLSISSNKYVILLLINILLLVLGTLIDMAPSILIATPILLPVMQNFGVNRFTSA